jgi:site-specific DNA-methyltransferase (cytosine-N4-specific)
MATAKVTTKAKQDDGYYRVPRPGLLWNGTDGELLQADGGKKRPESVNTSRKGKKALSNIVDADLPYPVAAADPDAPNL